MKAALKLDLHFSAAHALRDFPATHRCHRTHGHNYRVRFEVYGSIPQSGERALWIVADVDVWQKYLQGLIASLDHADLNEVLNTAMPTMEHIAHWIIMCAGSQPEELKGAILDAVEVWETDTIGCRVTREDHFS